MAQMLPPQIESVADAPPGERDLFQKFQDAPETGEWKILHSLDVASHRERVAGEVDFVVIIPGMGVLCIEVKSHRTVDCTDGRWHYGPSRKPGRSPFKQVGKTMHSLREQVQNERPELNHVVFWSAVAFPYLIFDERSPEWHPWQVIDERRLQASGVARAVRSVLQSARRYLADTATAGWFNLSSASPTLAETELIAETLRPQFEFYESPASRTRRREEEIKRYTEKQFGALDAMSRNPRVAFEGPAGTGKTLLAIEAARRAAARDLRVLVLCYNKLLGTWLEDRLYDLEPDVTTSTLHRYLVQFTGKCPREDAGSGFWEKELPEAALKMMIESERTSLFDYLIVDEAQDLLKDDYLHVMDFLLRGGLKHGQWLLFGDFAGQNIYQSLESKSGNRRSQLDRFMSRWTAGTPVFWLGENCRNRPRIAEFVESAAMLDPGYADKLRPDDHRNPQIHFYEDADKQSYLLQRALKKLYDQKVDGKEIVVVSPKAPPRDAASKLQKSPWDERLRPLRAEKPGGYVRHGTAHAFKGLEAPAVIVTDIEDLSGAAARELFYVATSRAQDRLIMLVSEGASAELTKIISR